MVKCSGVLRSISAPFCISWPAVDDGVCFFFSSHPIFFLDEHHNFHNIFIFTAAA